MPNNVMRRRPHVLWITGLSGSGKTTLAHEMALRLRATGDSVVLLDGDELREVFGAVAANVGNHGREGRLALAMQYAHLCRILVQQGLTVVIATISLFKEVHAWNRANLPGYFEAYLKVPVEELRRRDPKGIYRSFDAGELTDVAGLDLPIDEPEAADWVAAFAPERSVAVMAEDLLNRLNRRKVL
jgi:adenylylsulfate kinase